MAMGPGFLQAALSAGVGRTQKNFGNFMVAIIAPRDDWQEKQRSCF
jgi:hypothetical protein